MLKRMLKISLLYCIVSNAFAGKDCVILLHGLGRSHYSMGMIAIELKKDDYLVINNSYPSTSQSVETIAEESLPPLINECLHYHADSINFVTHSMGGIVLREYLHHHKIPKLFRIVMLAPPNHGSPLADWLKDTFIFRLLTGPAGQELQMDSHSVPNKLPKRLPYQIGIIAGNSPLLTFTSRFFNGPNDGIVSVDCTKMQRMRDFIVLPVTHSFMVYNDEVIEQAMYFLANGTFKHDGKGNFQ